MDQHPVVSWGHAVLVTNQGLVFGFFKGGIKQIVLKRNDYEVAAGGQMFPSAVRLGVLI